MIYPEDDWTPERRARLERGEQKIDGFDPLGTILVRQDDLRAALAMIDYLREMLDMAI